MGQESGAMWCLTGWFDCGPGRRLRHYRVQHRTARPKPTPSDLATPPDTGKQEGCGAGLKTHERHCSLFFNFHGATDPPGMVVGLHQLCVRTPRVFPTVPTRKTAMRQPRTRAAGEREYSSGLRLGDLGSLAGFSALTSSVTSSVRAWTRQSGPGVSGPGARIQGCHLPQLRAQGNDSLHLFIY